jgi:hypothetical protein
MTEINHDEIGKEKEEDDKKRNLDFDEPNTSTQSDHHHFEQVYDKIKQYGRYQIFSFLLIQYIM